MASTDAYEVLELIGQGAFGQIRKVRRRTDGLVLVRKEISYVKMTDKEKNQLVAEFEILARLKHRNIVEYFHRDHMKKDQSIHLYMEYCGNGDLSTIIKRCKAERSMVPEHFVWSIFTQVVLALYRCHNGVNPPDLGDIYATDDHLLPQATSNTVRILHRDLKPENIFLDMDHAVKLGDFGLSKMLAPEQQLATTYVGTPYYMSPELISEDTYTHKSDIWALGCIVYELCKLSPPFNAQSLHGLGTKIKEGRFSPIPNQYSPDLRRVIDMCLQRDPSKRPDTSHLLQLPYVKLNRREIEALDMGRSFKRKEEALRSKEEVLRSKEEVLRMREEELRRKDAQFAMEQELARKAIQEHCDALNAELRQEWERKAMAEIENRVAFQLEEVHKREAEAHQKWHSAWQSEVEKAAMRMIEEMDLVPRPLASSLLSNADDSGYGDSIHVPESPIHNFPRVVAPASPVDIDMCSPSVFDTSPSKPSKLFQQGMLEQAPPRMPLNLAPVNQLRPQSSIPNSPSMPDMKKAPYKNQHFSTSSLGSMDCHTPDTSFEEEPSPIRKRGALNRASTFTTAYRGSPMRGIGRTSDRFPQNTSKTRELGGSNPEALKSAPISSKALSLVQIARQNPEIATRDDIPSPFLKKTQKWKW
ncbi:uncharacterized protein H6S33_005870 [Morchella sextelata]|uniref:uncharacterized protein n=1 Tax=Morchella sextelata TaxID=1174677 RepID=UPI001D03F907|nr:uncharacterized protein H6S33_005870 [Morchella sextelata]KAH0613984.1 hypothetical protein H6S33_005870 [Morchella sextelata]